MPRTVRPALGELPVLVAESAGLDGAAGSVGPGIKEEHDGFTLEGGESDRLSVLVGQGEVGSFLVDVHDYVSIPQMEAGRHAGGGGGGAFAGGGGRSGGGRRSRSARLRGRWRCWRRMRTGSGG